MKHTAIMACAVVLLGTMAAGAQQAPPPINVPRPDKPQVLPLPRPETTKRRVVTEAAASDADAAKPAADAARPEPPPFIIGVWFQPLSSFAAWKARGINTLFGYESESNTVSMDDWCDAAALNELFTIRQPRGNFADDAKDPYLLAWMQQDEPDVKNVDPDVLGAAYRLWRSSNKQLPVFLSVSGGNVLFSRTKKQTYLEYFAAADWIGNDFYPVTGWGRPDLLPKVGQLVDTLRQWSGGKPQFTFIETSNQELEWVKDPRCATPGEVRAMIWDSVIHGAKGIVYFPQKIGRGFKFDATPTAVSVEVARQNRFLGELGPVLGSQANPPGMSVTVKEPLEAGWRKGPDGSVYVIVLNLSTTPVKGATIQCAGIAGTEAQVLNEEKRTLNIYGQSLTDDFPPTSCQIYQIKAP